MQNFIKEQLTINSIHLHSKTIPDMLLYWMETNGHCRHWQWQLVLVNRRVQLSPKFLFYKDRKKEKRQLVVLVEPGSRQIL